MTPAAYLQTVQAEYVREATDESPYETYFLEVSAILQPFAGAGLIDKLRGAAPGLVKDLGRGDTGLGDATLREIVRKVIERESGRDTQTPEQIFQGLVDRLSPSLSKQGLKPSDLRELIAIGTLQHDEPNARARLVPGGLGFVVLVHTGMWAFLSACSKVIALSTQPQGTSEPMLDSVVRDKLLRALVRLTAFAPGFLSRLETQHLSGYYQDAFAHHLAISTKQFVVAHELAHLICGHLSEQRDKLIRLASDSVTPLPTDWEQEHEADTIGMSLLINTNKQQDRREILWTYLGCDAFLGISHILERAFALSANSHPPAIVRRSRLREHLKANFPAAAEALLQPAETMGSLMDAMAESAACQPATAQ